jgi:hypothetical protein
MKVAGIPLDRVFRALFIAALASMFFPTCARADDASIFDSAIITPANNALRAADGQIAQQTPVGQTQAPLPRPGLPLGPTYGVDLSAANAIGNIGVKASLPGGVDAILGYGFNRNFRIQASYYSVQEYPTGFDSGVVPLYLQGLASPIGSADLSANPTDVNIDDKIFIVSAQSLVQLGKLPVVITPSYLARTGTIGGHTDATLVEINGFPQTVNLRTQEQYFLTATFPFLATPKFFGTFTLGPVWNVNVNGANTTNHPQLFQLAHLEYRVNRMTSLFTQYGLLQNYTPEMYYPNHVPTFIYGITERVNKYAYFQLQGSEGGTTNEINPSKYGIDSVTCQALPCGANQVAPQIGGLHAAQIQLQFGLGSPSVIPL